MKSKDNYSVENIRKYRPFLSDRVDDPWQDFPDLEEFNGDAYESLRYEIEEIIYDPNRQSRGCLILGEAGFGKTHLIMRCVKNLSESNHVMFIRRVNNADTITQYIWASMVQSLVKPLPNNEVNNNSQLDIFLSRVFSEILKKHINLKVESGEKVNQELKNIIKNEPKKIPSVMKQPRHRQIVKNIIRNRVQADHPEADLSFVDAFFKFFYLKEQNRKREIRSWLEGQIDDPEILTKIGLPAWVSDDLTPNYLAIKEEKAEKGIHTLSLLSHYYSTPLIVCFDQLEGLRGQNELVIRYTDVVREIFTRCSNFLIVTCIFPSLWEELIKYVDQSYIDRAGQTKIHLENLTVNSAKKIIQKRLAIFHSDLNIELSTAIDPFEERDIPALLFRDVEDKQSVFPIRQFIARCRESWKNWVLNRIPLELQHITPENLPVKTISKNSKNINEKTFSLEDPPNVVPTELNRVVEKDEIIHFIKEQVFDAEKFNNFKLHEEIPNEERLFAEILNIFSFLISRSKSEIYPIAKILRYKLVMPIYQRYSYGYSQIFGLSILNATGNRYTARMKNFLQNHRDKEFSESLLLRDLRVNDFPYWGKGGEHLKNYSRYGHIIRLYKKDLAVIRTIYSSIEEIRNHDWQIGLYTINLNDFYNWLIKSQYFLNTIVFRELINTDFGKVLYNSLLMQ